jgi:hypothetical protein
MQQDAWPGDLVVVGHSTDVGLLQCARARGIIEAWCAQSARCYLTLGVTVYTGAGQNTTCGFTRVVWCNGFTSVSWPVCSSSSLCTSFLWEDLRFQTMDASLRKNGLATRDIRQILGVAAEQTKVVGGR